MMLITGGSVRAGVRGVTGGFESLGTSFPHTGRRAFPVPALTSRNIRHWSTRVTVSGGKMLRA